MARWKFPQDRTVFVHTGPLKPILEPSHHGIVLYEDPECTRTASVAELDGASIPHSTIYTDVDGLLPEFYGPNDTFVLYGKPLGVEQVYPIEALYGPQIQKLIDEIPGHGGTDQPTLVTGDGPPGPGSGSVGDIYLDLLTYTIYGPKTEDGWPATGEPLVGPQGPQGDPGPQGPQGEQGPQGLPGWVPQSYTHVQNSVSDLWTVVHNLGYRPGGILVRDSAGVTVEGNIVHVDANSFTVSFNEAISGEVDVS